MQLGWCFGWIIQLDHAVLIATVNLGPMGGGDVGVERPDVPRADVEDVSHGGRIGGPPERPGKGQAAAVSMASIAAWISD
jgi:hypothetical protein